MVDATSSPSPGREPAASRRARPRADRAAGRARSWHRPSRLVDVGLEQDVLADGPRLEPREPDRGRKPREHALPLAREGRAPRRRAACRRGSARGTRRRASGRPRAGATARRRRQAPRAPRASGPGRSSSSEPSGSGPRPKASRRGCLTTRDVARVEPRIVPAHRSHADRDGVRLRAQARGRAGATPRRSPSARPGTVDAAVERHRDLVSHERASLQDPRPPLLDLLPRAEAELAVRDRDLDPCRAQPLEPAAVLRIRVELARRRPGRYPRRSARRRTAASRRDARRARA